MIEWAFLNSTSVKQGNKVNEAKVAIPQIVRCMQSFDHYYDKRSQGSSIDMFMHVGVFSRELWVMSQLVLIKLPIIDLKLTTCMLIVFFFVHWQAEELQWSWQLKDSDEVNL